MDLAVDKVPSSKQKNYSWVINCINYRFEDKCLATENEHQNWNN
jgi:hypothetical protein